MEKLIVGKENHILPLTSLRFFAAIWVVGFHFRDIFRDLIQIDPIVYKIFSCGHYAVPLFFILSGFILMHVYGKKYALSNHHRFIWNRVVKIWPLHLLCIAMLVGYCLLVVFLKVRIPVESYDFSKLITEALMIRCWWDNTPAWNYPAWSIHAEFFAYLFIFPIGWLFLKQQMPILVLVALVFLCIFVHSLVSTISINSCVPSIIFLFLSGMVLCKLKRNITSPQNGDLFVVISILLICIGFNIHPRGVLQDFTTYAGFAALILSLTIQDGKIFRFLSQPYLVYGGGISYAIYMIHALFQQFHYTIYGKICGLLPPHIYLFLLLSSLVLTAILIHAGFESPINKILKNERNR